MAGLAPPPPMGQLIGMCLVIDERGRLIAKATSTCLTLRGDQATGR